MLALKKKEEKKKKENECYCLVVNHRKVRVEKRKTKFQNLVAHAPLDLGEVLN